MQWPSRFDKLLDQQNFIPPRNSNQLKKLQILSRKCASPMSGQLREGHRQFVAAFYFNPIDPTEFGNNVPVLPRAAQAIQSNMGVFSFLLVTFV